MSTIQKLFVAILPQKWSQSMENASRNWITHCPCGFERSFWDAGGIRWAGGGKENVYLTCPQCGISQWHKVYRKPATADPKTASHHPA